ncbi:golvesin C-terminal-like domain-containing protein [Desulfosudis oleivorans]|uniref:Golvesin/Xly CBD-like domain-containing protein n=1 Tax=Desulfosudis oleivorans (strain DSM 6200 / JCM 39069 / Hxd3) TaxID=96561 RepID=A9A0W8_DESOH|nr:hypothetical protein [Desulfosudis oleivorans]ABW67593.1 hypothetical protein Dole_1789 [Desulfosudis oleivorans Hxd3]
MRLKKILFMLALSGLMAITAHANTPGDTVPGLVNIVWDGSGSMVWTIATDETFYWIDSEPYAYVFPETEYYYDGSSYGRPLPADNRNHWQPQCSFFNYMYYNPEVNYTPWPRWTTLEGHAGEFENFQADINTPLQHPIDISQGVFDLNDNFFSWDLVLPDGLEPEDVEVVVDNSDIPSITVDDMDAGFLSDPAIGSWIRYENPDYIGNDYYTIRYSGKPTTATWQTDITNSGEYEVLISVPFGINRTREANYTVFHDNGSNEQAISQRADTHQEWISLGSYNFTDTAKIMVISSQAFTHLAVDAVMLVPKFDTSANLPVAFSSTGPWQTVSSSQAYPDATGNSHCLVTAETGTPCSATWQANNLDPSITYDVYARWVEGSDRSTAVEYNIDHIDGSQAVTVNQRLNGGAWCLLASGLGFGCTGTVTLSHTPTDLASDSACADAVLFVKSGLRLTGDTIFAHYFIQKSPDDVFLIDLNGGIAYFRALLAPDGKTVEALTQITEEEAGAEGLVTGRTYLEERQNFANWYQFYRRRYFTGIATLGQMINDWSNVFLRITSFPPDNFFRRISPVDVTIRNTDGELTHYNEKDDILYDLYTMMHPWGGTFLREGLYQAGQFFELGRSDFWPEDRWENLPPGAFQVYSSPDYYPFFTPENGGAYQQAFTVVMTDGLWNGTLRYPVGNVDGGWMYNPPFTGGVFGDDYSDTAADVAMYFYCRDLRPILNDIVPPGDFDFAPHQHMVTYAVALGVRGAHFSEAYRQMTEPYLRYGAEPPSWIGWPQIVPDTNSTIDDLWHATINGRGSFFSAMDVNNLAAAMAAIRQDITQRLEIPSTPANLINWNGNLVADFGDNGLWYHNGSNWNWMTNRGHVNQMVVWDGKLVVDFGADHGMHYYDGSWHWMTNKDGVAMMTVWGNKLVVDFGNGRSVYNYDGAWHWMSNKDDVADMTVWNNKLVVDFGGGRSVYNYDGAWHWMSNKDDVADMTVWNNKLVVDFGGGRGMFNNDGTWHWMTNKDDVAMMTVWGNKLVVDFGNGRSVYNYDGSWHWMTNKDDVAKMVTWKDGADKLAVDFGSGRGMFYYDGVWHWMSNKDDITDMIAWGTCLAVDFGSGRGMYNYDGAWHWMKNWSTAD